VGKRIQFEDADKDTSCCGGGPACWQDRKRKSERGKREGGLTLTGKRETANTSVKMKDGLLAFGRSFMGGKGGGGENRNCLNRFHHIGNANQTATKQTINVT